jgi:Histidine kinase-, DNA gyrase B-, and HSP90-like ATPase/Dienelactone hydrolase family
MRVCVGIPAGTPKAGILVMCHGPGVDAFVADRVDALAKHGYLAAAPDLFHRQPEGGDVMARIGKLRDDEIIDPFFTTKDVGRGTGQGLSISRTMIERHGGSLTFETEVGRGTTFHLRLPIESTARRAA